MLHLIRRLVVEKELRVCLLTLVLFSGVRPCAAAAPPQVFHYSLRFASFLQGGKSAVVGYPGSRALELYDLRNPFRLKRSVATSFADFRSIAVCPQPATIAVGGATGMVEVFSLAPLEKQLCSALLRPSITSLALSPDAKRVAAGGVGEDGSIVAVLDTGTGKITHSLRGHSKAIHSLLFTLDGTRLLTSDEAGVLRCWELPSGKLAWSSGVEKRWVGVMCVTGRALVTGGLDGALRVFDIATGRQRAHLIAVRRSITSLAITPDAKLAAFYGTDSMLCLWDLDKGKLIASRRMPYFESPALSVHADQSIRWYLGGVPRTYIPRKDKLVEIISALP